MKFKDLFSAVAENYLSYRPTYPKALYDYLSTLVPKESLVWDCGCGNGQAAAALADYFDEVIASDPSKEQIQSAIPVKNVEYHVWAAERTELKPNSIDLITVAQALHWFDHPRFFEEAKRVLKPNGVIAIWSYQFCSVNPEIDKILQDFYDMRLGPYWSEERRYVNNAYRDIEFPFKRMDAPQFEMKKNWNADHLLGYFGTWSATQKCRESEGIDPIKEIKGPLHKVWKDRVLTVKWPLHLIVGRKEPA